MSSANDLKVPPCFSSKRGSSIVYVPANVATQFGANEKKKHKMTCVSFYLTKGTKLCVHAVLTSERRDRCQESPENYLHSNVHMYNACIMQVQSYSDKAN